MSNQNASAQARYRARTTAKLSFFDRMDFQRAHMLRMTFSTAEPSPEEAVVRFALLNHPDCFAGIDGVTLTNPPSGTPYWRVTFDAEEPNSRLCAAIAVAALFSASSLSSVAVPTLRSDAREDLILTGCSPDVVAAASDIETLKACGLWGRHQ